MTKLVRENPSERSTMRQENSVQLTRIAYHMAHERCQPKPKAAVPWNKSNGLQRCPILLREKLDHHQRIIEILNRCTLPSYNRTGIVRFKLPNERSFLFNTRHEPLEQR